MQKCQENTFPSVKKSHKNQHLAETECIEAVVQIFAPNETNAIKHDFSTVRKKS